MQVNTKKNQDGSVCFTVYPDPLIKEKVVTEGLPLETILAEINNSRVQINKEFKAMEGLPGQYQYESAIVNMVVDVIKTALVKKCGDKVEHMTSK